jgi:two-component system OmpR family sensor kinase/two-component system sensor histidine kinase BaeS
MNHLWVRLALAFVGVTLVTVVVVALLADVNAGTQFRHYLERREADSQAGRGQGGGPGFGMGGHGPMMMSDSEQEFLDQMRTTLLIAGLAAGGIGIVLGVVISRTIAAPLSSLAAAAREFARRRWEHRAPVDGPAEIAEVARAFNTMADELERAEIHRRNLMADIAHELRTL